MDITNDIQLSNQLPRKRKRARLLLDARTELTDDELKESQSILITSASEE